MSRTLYLIDTNVFREFHPRGHANVRAWLATIDDDQIRVSPVIYREMRGGVEAQRRKLVRNGKDTTLADGALAALDQFEKDYEDRQVPATLAVEGAVAKMLGAKGKNTNDVVLAATALVHDLVVVTRNVSDFAGRGVRVLDPFKKPPTIVTV